LEFRYYAVNTVPNPLDVVWCLFPKEEFPHLPSEDPHPCLVRTIELDRRHTIAWIEVCFGTSKNIMDDPEDLVISNLSEMDCAGLYYATRFKLDKCRNLPWCVEFFVPPPGKVSSIIGKLGQQSRVYLEELKKLRADFRRARYLR
jgi:hypothetical protein